MSSNTDNESKLCMFCGVYSKQKRKDPNRITTYVGNPGMISFNEEDKKSSLLEYVECSKCMSKSYITCIKSLCELMEKNRDHSNDTWYNDVKK